MHKIHVGTSVLMYDWNPDGFQWYIEYSKLNSVELNASFYRFPYPNQISNWAERTLENFSWSIKVNRWITHRFKMGERALKTWIKFQRLFKPLEGKISFYLFQLPPSFKPSEKNVRRLEKFIETVKLNGRLALEFRSGEWFSDKWVSWCRKLEATMVSVDSPEIQFYTNTSGQIYLRLHGRSYWYSHNYSIEELEEIAEKILSLKAESYYIYFNNDHDMLENARLMLKILREI